MDELISRQAAIDAAMHDVSSTRTHEFNAGATRAANRIKQLPSAEPKRGKWIVKDDTERFIAQCNCCRYIEDSRRIKNFCPNCGAKMEVTT